MWKQAQSSEGKGAYLPPLFKSLELLWQPKSDTHRYNLQNLKSFQMKGLQSSPLGGRLVEYNTKLAFRTTDELATGSLKGLMPTRSPFAMTHLMEKDGQSTCILVFS